MAGLGKAFKNGATRAMVTVMFACGATMSISAVSPASAQPTTTSPGSSELSSSVAQYIPLSDAQSSSGSSSAEPGPGAAVGALDCNSLYSVNHGASTATKISPVDGTRSVAFPILPSGTTYLHNQLGISPTGEYAVYTSYTSSLTQRRIYKYDAITGVTTTGPLADTSVSFTHGAINPATGVFYYGGAEGNGWSFAAYDPATNTSLGKVLTVTGTKPGDNGDIAFNAAGDMFIVAASEVTGTILAVPGPMPTAPSPPRAATVVSPLSTAFAFSNSIAFGPAYGYLYVGGGDGGVWRVDPRTGVANGNLGDIPMTDMGSCFDPFTIGLYKNLPDGRVNPGDQFYLEIVSSGPGNSTTTAGDKVGLQDQVVGPLAIVPTDTTYTFIEAAAGTTDLDDYRTTWECTAQDGTVVGEGEGTTGTVQASREDSGQAFKCVFTNEPAQMRLEKSAEPAEGIRAGDTVTYTYTITNTAGPAINNIAVEELEFTGNPTPAVSCPPGPLAPGASTQCTATYTVTAADVENVCIDNLAVATGTTSATGTVQSNDSEARVCTEQSPQLEIEKSADPSTNLRAGDTVTYSFAVTNSGNLTLHGVEVLDLPDRFTGTGEMSAIECPQDVLVPDETMTCTATYVITDADVAAGFVHNAATATGLDPNGEVVNANESDAEVTTATDCDGSTSSLGCGSLGSAGSAAVGSLGSLGPIGSLGSVGSLGALGSAGSLGALGSAGSSGGGSGLPPAPGPTPEPGPAPGPGPTEPPAPGPTKPPAPGPTEPEHPGPREQAPPAPAPEGSSPEGGGRIDSGLGAEARGDSTSIGLVAGGLALVALAGGVLLVALRRRRPRP